MASKVSKIGSVLVIGGGIAGIQACLDLANSGYFVYLVERSSAIGGIMAQLDKTFPTNDCSICILSPKLVECGRHLNIEILTLSEVKEVSGKEGNLKVKIVQYPRYIDIEKCVACGICAQKCPKKVKDEFNIGLGVRKAAYIKFPQAIPLKYVIDPASCIWFKKPGRCGACQKYCPVDAVDFQQTPKEILLNVGAVILAPGSDSTILADSYPYVSSPNVISSMEFERILSATGPYEGHLLRPSDGKAPEKIAWLQCIGSRNQESGYCSAVCCMYAIKEAIIAKEHSKKPLDTSIFFMDMRTCGKEFEEYYRRAEEELGIRFIRSRVRTIDTVDGGDLKFRYATEQGEIIEEVFNMVVLSTGLKPKKDAVELANRLDIKLNHYDFALTSSFSPVNTSRPGIYVCGAFQGPKDIPQSVMEASAAVCASSTLLAEARGTLVKEKTYPPEKDVADEEPRIGVFVCHCGINIGGVVNVPRVRDYAGSLPFVVYVEDNLFTCSQDTQETMKKTIKEYNLNRVVVASCSPKTHEPLFQETIRERGLNKHLFEMVNIRDQCSWVHRTRPEEATEKAKDLICMAVARARFSEPLPHPRLAVNRSAIVVGGGVAGMVSALALANQGFKVCLVEKEDHLGGKGLKIRKTWRGEDVQAYIINLVKEIESHAFIEVHTRTYIKEFSGSVGNFRSTLSSAIDGKIWRIQHGVVILATGAKPARTDEYLYGRHPNVFSGFDMDQQIASRSELIKNAKAALFIQCVGSRNSQRPYCSKICCTQSLASALELKSLNPDIEIYILYRDIRTYGFREDIYNEAREKGIIFIRYDLDRKPQVEEELESHGPPRLKVTIKDILLNEDLVLHPDFISLATAIVPNDQKELASIFKVPLNKDGFFVEAHMKLRPVDFASEGIFVCGMAHYPKPIEESIAQAQAAAARASTILSKEYIEAEGMVAAVDEELCVTCLTCVRVCPYGAPFVNEKGKANIEAVMCQGCGTCVADCPVRAIKFRYLKDEQIIAGCEALLERY